MCVEHASSSPPPMTAPCMAVMSGRPQSWMSPNRRCAERELSTLWNGVTCTCSDRSRPAQKWSPAPWMTTALTVSGILAKASRSPRNSLSENALRFSGRLRVTMAMRPSTRSRTVWSMIFKFCSLFVARRAGDDERVESRYPFASRVGHQRVDVDLGDLGMRGHEPADRGDCFGDGVDVDRGGAAESGQQLGSLQSPQLPADRLRGQVRCDEADVAQCLDPDPAQAGHDDGPPVGVTARSDHQLEPRTSHRLDEDALKHHVRP